MNETGWPSLTPKIDAAFRQAAREVLRVARQTGTPVIVWENGQVREIPCDLFDVITPPTKVTKPIP
jgi:hypothetical protein